MIRHNHPDLKGSFTCLGNWYNVLDIESMNKLKELLKTVNKADLKQGKKEIKTAKLNINLFSPDKSLWFLYRDYYNENKNDKSKLLKVDFI